jgi:carotenoid cleavage dioxygenase-like enzyme
MVCARDGEAQSVIKLWTPVCKDLDLDLQKSNTFHMTEYTIDPNTKTVTAVVIDDTINSEFSNMPPPLKESPDGGPRRIGSTLSIHDHYGFTSIFGDHGEFIGYAKWDMVSRCLDSTVYYAANEVGGEPMIVRAKADGRGDGSGTVIEDDVVYVGSYVYNEDEDQSYFLLFDGETNKQVCRLKMPCRVPFGFHGQFISGDEFASHFRYHEARERDGINTQCPIQWIRFFIRDFVLGRSVYER